MASLRIVHTSDIHLGKQFPQLTREGEQMRQRDLEHVFGDIIDHAAKSEANLLVIAGDLFDRVNVPHETIAMVLASFGKFHARCPEGHIILAPGETELLQRSADTQDSLLNIFRHLPFAHLLGAGQAADTLRLTLGGQNVTVSSAPIDIFLSPDFRSKDIPLVRDAFGLFVLHAHSRRHAFDAEDASAWAEHVFSPLATRGYRYLALGHRHSLHQVPASDLMAVFPGAPERLSFETDRDRKYFVTVEVADGVVRMKPVATRIRPLEYISVTCTPGEDKVTPVLKSLTGNAPDRILCLVLEGQMDDRTFSAVLHSEELADVRSRYAIVHIDNRLVLVDSEAGYDYGALRVEAPAEEFRRHVEREIAQAKDPAEAALLRELLAAGLAEIEEGP